MSATLNLGTSVDYAFNAVDWATLAINLPGPNR